MRRPTLRVLRSTRRPDAPPRAGALEPGPPEPPEGGPVTPRQPVQRPMPPAQSSPPLEAWEEDLTGASIVLSTGRADHELLVIAEPALLTEVDAEWGRPASRVRLSFLPGVHAPTTLGQEDALESFDRRGAGVLVARGRTVAFEGKPEGATTAFARTAAGVAPTAALLITRATSLGEAGPGEFLAVGDHLSLTGAPLFHSTGPVDAAWDDELASLLAGLDGVRGAGIVAHVPGPVRPSGAQAALLAGLGADAAVTDSVAEAMVLASHGVRVACLAYLDRAVQRSAGGRRVAEGTPAHGEPLMAAPSRVPAPDVVLAAVEAVLDSLR